MTKPKIINGNFLNPITRLETRFAEYKRCHLAASKNCKKVQELHNENSNVLKYLLERKSKLSDIKMKKKRSSGNTVINRRRIRLSRDQIHNHNATLLENYAETTPNVTLNIHSSEIPEIDWDSFDIIDNQNFSVPINEQEHDGVLNNCWSQCSQISDGKHKQLLNVCNTMSEIINEGFCDQNSATCTMRGNDLVFMPSENQFLPRQYQKSNSQLKFEHVSPQNYLTSSTCNCNFDVNIVSPNVHKIDPQNAVFSSHDFSYQYNYPLVPEDQIIDQCFYQCPHYDDHFQLPAVSSGWYNSFFGQNNQSTMHQQQHPVTNSVAISVSCPNIGQYQQPENSHVPYHGQMFVNNHHTQTYDCQTQATIANYRLISEQKYYYIDYHCNNNDIDSTHYRSIGNDSSYQ